MKQMSSLESESSSISIFNAPASRSMKNKLMLFHISYSLWHTIMKFVMGGGQIIKGGKAILHNKDQKFKMAPSFST